MTEIQTTQEQTSRFLGGFQLFSPSIEALGKNFWVFCQLILLTIGTGLGAFLLLILFGGMASSNDSVNVISGIFIALVVAVLMVLNFWINGAFIAVQLASVNKHHITMRASLDKTKPKLWQWIGLQIVLMVIYIVAMVLLVIPFFFAMRRYILAPYYMIDRGTGIRESLRQSSEDSKRFSGPLWGLVGVNLLSQIIPIASILYMYAPAIRYKEITDASRVEPSAPDPTA